MVNLTLYGKAGCHLCEDARLVVEEVRAELGVEVEEVDITTDPVLFRRYGERIPVVALEGEDVLELQFDAAALRRALGRVAEP
jgi:glutaredoxin